MLNTRSATLNLKQKIQPNSHVKKTFHKITYEAIFVKLLVVLKQLKRRCIALSDIGVVH